jgi:glycine dehydrogenase subunit 1
MVMLGALGLPGIESLFADVPEKHRFPDLDLDLPLSEPELLRQLQEIADRNNTPALSFLGGGVYHQFIPSIVDALSSRGEFLTSYTPYQPEVSQGTLQATFEYQSMVSRLIGMDVVNASHYDGSTAVGEAVLMALRIARKQNTIVLGPSINPEYSSVIRTYLSAFDVSIISCDVDTNPVDVELPEDLACLVVQVPDYRGRIHDLAGLADRVHASGGILIIHTDPIANALFRTPGQWGADIATAEGQSLGIPVSYGGPYLGILGCRTEHLRKMPGRLVGMTRAADGSRGFVLTLNTREQHIRRERATSNICTNQGLMALRAAIYLAAMGPRGLKQVAELCYHRAHYAAARIAELRGFDVQSDRPFFREFVVNTPENATKLVGRMADQNVAAGIPLSDTELLVAVTEMNTKADIDTLVERLRRAS